MGDNDHMSAAGTVATGDGAIRFGERPLDQTVEVAAAMRKLTTALLSLEHESPVVDEIVTQLREWDKTLTTQLPSDPAPRIGAEWTAEQRLYLDHAFDIGAYNPAFPVYEITESSAESASGTVNFPIVYEGPPGLVHGGFLGVFFDSVIQQHNCGQGVAGKTRSLTITFRRPTPLDTDLRFDIVRAASERSVISTARLWRGDELVCTGVLDSVALTPERLAGSSYGPRGDL